MKHIVIFGPTAIGKTSLSIKLAKYLSTEIISADSVQVYKELDIVSAKVSEEEKSGIKHYLLDEVELNNKFTAYNFMKRSEEILSNSEKPIVIVGGTGLYIKALTDGLIEYSSEGNICTEERDYSFEKLQSLDSSLADKIGRNNKQKIESVLKAYYRSGIEPKDFNKYSKSKNDFYKFALIMDREELYNRINRRVDLMLEQGLIEEVRRVYKKRGPQNIIGFKELVEYFENRLTLEEAIDKIKQNSRRYAKRQITWMKTNSYDVIDIDRVDPFEYIIDKIKQAK